MQKVDLKLEENNWQISLRDEADQSVFNEIFKLGEYRSADNAIKTAKHAIVDVGAHAGFFTMYCRLLNKEVKIYAVEPEPGNLKLLKQHLDENKILGVKVIAGALAGETGERELIVSEDSHNHRLASALSPVPGRLRRPVRGLAFSDFCKQNKIKKISLLKIDIEGGEYELFESLYANDLSMVNFVILEYHNNTGHKFLGGKQIEEKLRANGFGVQVFPSHFDKTMGFIWAKNKRFKF